MAKGKGKTHEVVFGIQKQQLKGLSTKEYETLKLLSHTSKNMYNCALYNIRQYYFTEHKYLSYESNYHLCKTNENYQTLNANMAQQILKVVDRNFKSFFALIELAKNGNYQYKDIKIPSYLDKNGYCNLIFAEFSFTNGTFNVPMSAEFRKTYGKVSIKVPSNILGKKVKEVRIIPKNNARFFEIQYVYEIPEETCNLSKNNILAIDLGVDNLASCITNTGGAFIIDGKKLKSVNQWANKENARLQSIKDSQGIKSSTVKQSKVWDKRNRYVDDFLNKSARYIINYCIKNDIGKIVLGYNPTIQKEINIGSRNNQNFVNIPMGQLRDKIAYLAKRYNILVVETEESYTSKSSYFDSDILPKYNALNKEEYIFSGRRIKRGLYRTKDGKYINADINGALNILKKVHPEINNLSYKNYTNPLKIKVS